MIEHIDTFSPILLNAGLAIHRGDWNYTNISNPFFRLYLVVEGEASLTVKGKSHRLLPGHLYLIPPYTLHDDSCTGLFSLYYIHVYDNSKQALSLFDQYECSKAKRAPYSYHHAACKVESSIDGREAGGGFSP